MKALLCSIACGLVVVVVCNKVVAQIPDWEDVHGPLPTVSGISINAVACDGYGQHVVGIYGTHLYYYLLDNSGGMIWSQELTPPSGFALYASVTSLGDIVNVVASTSTNQICLFRSSNGGSSWSSPEGYARSGVTMTHIDAISNQIGLHISWDGGNEVYYVQYRTGQGFIPESFKNITDFTSGSGVTGSVPKVLTAGSTVIVSFIGSDPSPALTHSAMTRQGDLSVPTITWDVSPCTAGVSDVNFAQGNIGIRGNRIYMIMAENFSPQHLRRTERDLSSPTWGAIEDLGTYGAAPEHANFRREMTTVEDTLHITYAVTSAVPPDPVISRIYHNAFRSPSGWSEPPFIVARSENDPEVYLVNPTISSSGTGAYVFWVRGNNASMRRKVYALSGSITENGFWTGNNWLSASTSIESGVTITAKSASVTHLMENAQLIISRGGSLVIEPGAKFMFANGTSMMVRGTFHANGTSSNPIVFELEKTGTSRWDGISVANPSIYNSVDFVLDNVQLSGASCAIHIETPVKADVLNCSITNVSTMGIEVVPNWGGGPCNDIVHISNTNISVNRCHGIVIANTSDVRVEDCTIIGHGQGDNPLFAGISLNNASPRILRTSLSYHDYGLLAVASSSPILQDVETGGHNIIRDNGRGVKCDDNSNAILGDDAGTIEFGGQNCIHSNGLDAHLSNNSGVPALYNYWGYENGPDPQKLLIEDVSWLKYEPYLTGDPNERANAPVLSGAGGGDDPISENPAILQAIHYRVVCQHQEAIALLHSVVGDRTASTAVKAWAITELLNNVRAARISGHTQYLRTLATTNPELVRAISSTLPQTYISEGNSEQAVNEWDRNIQAYPNSVLECDGLYGNFLVALYRDHDLTQAGSLLSRLDSRYPDAHQTQLAEAQLTLAQASHNGLGKRKEENEAGNAIPSKYRLEQNYPNPFNPTTEIRFDLPDAGNVSLVVYDVLGREVANLANGYREVGYHSATWNASAQASGVYFARFSVINAEGKMAYSKVNKLMLVR